ncbi:MAG: DUF294 nucleotidyltransferase-like domain-containing protein [Thermodesulfovibrionales bacterium]
MLKEDTIRFLERIPPFKFLGAEELGAIADDVYLKYYPSGTRVLEQNGKPSEYLYIIKKGAARVYITSEDGAEILIDFRSEGDSFGFISMMSEDRSRANVETVEDAICYLVPKKTMLSVLKAKPGLNEYFLKSFFINFIDRTHEETRRRFSAVGESDRALYTTPVGSIVRREPVTAVEDTPLKEAASIMARERVSSLVIMARSGVPVGIVTDRDFREKVVARGRDLGDPVKSVMSTPLIRVDASEYCFEALVRMMRYNIHHILVIEDGTLKGVVTNHDFMVLQGSSPTALVKAVEKAEDFGALSKAYSNVFKIVSTLMREGARARHITGFITEISEKVINRVFDVLEKRLGPPPAPYCLFMYGDGGRRELTLRGHLRLGFIVGAGGNGNGNGPAKYFEDLRGMFLEAAASCGLRAADGEEMFPAENIRSLAGWKEEFDASASDPFGRGFDEEFFEARAIRGDADQATALRVFLRDLAERHEEFMDYIGTRTVRNRPPLGFFKKFVVEKTGEHRDKLNLYEKGLRPLAASTRIFALERKARELSTFQRLEVLGGRYGFEQAENMGHAFEYLAALLLHHQLTQMESGAEAGDFINPESLAGLEKKTLKESFQLIADVYDVIEKKYRTERPRP